MPILKRPGTRGGCVAALALVTLLAACGGAPSVPGTPTPIVCNGPTPVGAPSVPPGAPVEDSCYATEWPAPNGDLYNTRVAHSTIASTNASKLGVAWTVPLHGEGADGADVANPVLANGIAYLQDGASNVIAVQYATGRVLWTHDYNAPEISGPNGVTIANGRIYGVTPSGVFALDARTGQQVWYDTQLGAGQAHFDIAPQVANGKVFVSSAITVGGGLIYALDANTGATLWSFQTVIDKVGQQLKATAGGAWDAMLIGPDDSVYAGIGNPYLSLQEALVTPSRELYTDSIVKLNQTTGRLESALNPVTCQEEHQFQIPLVAEPGVCHILEAGSPSCSACFPNSGVDHCALARSISQYTATAAWPASKVTWFKPHARASC